ncbi:hypothetical protein J132_08653 [Termitomyces sp. J132]|nr:hypothetical protein J132_08653 [Termitomyces sp. J132]
MADLASKLEKITMAHAFLDWVDHLLSLAHVSLVKNPRLAVTTIFQTWLQWFKTMGSGAEWLELANVEKECCQLYKQYKGKEWAPVNPSLKFLLDDLMAGMMLFEDLSPNDQFFFQHPVGALEVVRGEKWSEGRSGKEKVDHRDIQEGPSTPKAVAGSVARGLEQIEETFSNKCLVTLLYWQKALTMVDTGLGAGLVLKKAKGKVIMLLNKQQEFKHIVTTAGPTMTQRAAGTHRGPSPAIIATAPGGAGEAVVGGSGVTKVKSRELVESDKEGDGNDGSDNDSDNNMLLAQKQPARPTLVASAKQLWTVASKEGEGDVEMRETTPLVMVTEVEQEASNMEVKGEEEFEAAPVAIEEDKEEDEGAGEVKGTWSDTPLQQVGNDKLEWLGKDLA